MKINTAIIVLEGLLSNTDSKPRKTIYKQLERALHDLKERDLSSDQLNSVEEALNRLRLNDAADLSVRELKRHRKQWIKDVTAALSLVTKGYYTALGMAFGVAAGGAASAIINDFSTSSTGLAIGLGLIAGYLVGNYLDIEATKKNRVMNIRT